MKRPDGITFLAIWHFFLSASCLLGLLTMLGVGGLIGVAALAEEDVWITALEIGIFGGFASFLLLFSIVFLVVGAGLWRMRPWARIPALVIAAVSLVKFPIGTVVGGLTLWYLLRDEGGGTALKADVHA
ncbi:MAG: hypothetical protein R3E97_13690 [Candidatus Eisenbacteria bacterium]